jgi:hypothetical protein
VAAFLGRERCERHEPGKPFPGCHNGHLPSRELTVSVSAASVRLPRVAQVPETFEFPDLTGYVTVWADEALRLRSGGTTRDGTGEIGKIKKRSQRAYSDRQPIRQ